MIENTNNEESLPNIKFLIFGKTNGDAEILTKTEKEIGYPCFVRPNNTDSLFGISRARNIHELREGIVKAFRHDDHIVIEEAIETERKL